MAIGKFLNFGEEQYITGELSDEEIMDMVRHAAAEERTLIEDESGSSEILTTAPAFLSTKEALQATRDLIKKIIDDTEGTPEDALKLLDGLRSLERLWQRKIMEKAALQPQASILSFFQPSAM